VNSGEEDDGQRITWLASRGGRPEACGGNGGAVGDRWQLSVSIFLFFLLPTAFGSLPLPSAVFLLLFTGGGGAAW